MATTQTLKKLQTIFKDASKDQILEGVSKMIDDARGLMGMGKGDRLTITALTAPQKAKNSESIYLRFAGQGVKQLDGNYKNSTPGTCFQGKNAKFPELSTGDKAAFNGAIETKLDIDVEGKAIVFSNTANFNFPDQIQDIRKKAARAEATADADI